MTVATLVATGLLLLGGGLLGGCGTSPGSSLSLPEGTVVTARNHRELVPGSGGMEPRYLGGRDAGVCLEVPAETDASQWRASLVFRGAPDLGEPSADREPAARSGRVLCFEHSWPEGLDPPVDVDLCGSVTDLYDGTVFELPCRTLRFEPDSGDRSALMQEVNSAVSTRHEGSPESLAERLAAVADRARDQGLPALDVRTRLIAVHYLLQEGDASQVRRVERLLRSLPSWLDDPAATALAADAAYLRGVLDLQRLDRLEDAWQSFLEAEALYGRILDKKRLAAVRGQAEVLARVGAVREGLYRLEAALESCGDPAPCSSIQQLDARGLHAWLTLIDSYASPEEQETAAGNLDTLQGEPVLDPQERANHLINLALLRARQGREPGPALTEARRLVAPANDSRRAELLRGWSHMAEALYELSRSDADLERARARCRVLTAERFSDRLRAWAFSCLGRVHRRQGRPSLALEDFHDALALHEEATPERLDRLLPLGPGQRADDHYRAARAALDLGDAGQAWKILSLLDHLPPGGTGTPEAAAPGGAVHDHHERQDRGYRAFAVDDEILLLHRDRTGGVTLARRTILDGGDLRERTDLVDRALDERRLSDPEWRELLRPLAEALAPPSDASPEAVTSYALHGLLQRVPLAALPTPEGAVPEDLVPQRESSISWLADRTTVAVRPAGSAARSAARPDRIRHPLIVLDPTRNLRARRELAGFYSRRFPDGRLLVGPEGTEAAFRGALPTASWLHVDTHGTYDPAFPERSSLELADGAVTLRELASLPWMLTFANLSGCRTGTWPVTADSGRYGIGGLIASRGARWVIASRADLLDDLAVSFNPVLYRALEAGTPVPEAYDLALEHVRERFPAVVWASLFLIEGPTAGAERAEGRRMDTASVGQARPLTTPSPLRTHNAHPAGGGDADALTPASR